MNEEIGRNALRLSIVIPIKNEEENVLPLAGEIDAACATAEYGVEILWVDDGSIDHSVERIRTLGPAHRLLRLDRNHGQSVAFMAGFEAACGEWIGTLDGDGQNDPRDLLRQLEHARSSGVDMVNGIRAHRSDGWLRRIASRIANAARNALTGRTATDVGCSTRVVRAEALRGLPFFHGMHRFLPTLVLMRGYRIDEIEVNHRPRRHGRSKYGINDRLWTGLVDLLGVRWLRARQRVWQAREEVRSVPRPASTAGSPETTVGGERADRGGDPPAVAEGEGQ